METRNRRQTENGTLRVLTAAELRAVIGGVEDMVPVLDQRVPEDRQR
jgi:hypothetical protein